MNNRFQDKTVVVTGASGGIGAAICRQFEAEGANVVAMGGRVPSVGEMRLSCDLGDDDAVRSAADAIHAEWGTVYCVVHAAAKSENEVALSSSSEAFLDIYNVNVVGALRLAQAFAPRMVEAKDGNFVFVSSINSQFGCPPLAAYATSKGGLDAFTKTLALELAEHNVRVNTLSPASVDTPLLRDKFQSLPDPEAALAENAKRHPLGRLGQPEDIAEFTLFLASEAAGWMTGGVHLIDGGAHINRK